MRIGAVGDGDRPPEREPGDDKRSEQK